MRILSSPRAVAFVLALVAFPSAEAAQRPVVLSDNAPRDKPIGLAKCHADAYERATAPLTKEARATFGDARQRFLAGLPPKWTMFVRARLRDSTGRYEDTFVVVDSISGSRIVGRIW